MFDVLVVVVVVVAVVVVPEIVTASSHEEPSAAQTLLFSTCPFSQMTHVTSFLYSDVNAVAVALVVFVYHCVATTIGYPLLFVCVQVTSFAVLTASTKFRQYILR